MKPVAKAKEIELLVSFGLIKDCVTVIEVTGAFIVELTTSSKNPSLMGTKVAELLLEKIQSNELTNREVIFLPRLIEGKSVKDI